MACVYVIIAALPGGAAGCSLTTGVCTYWNDALKMSEPAVPGVVVAEEDPGGAGERWDCF